MTVSVIVVPSRTPVIPRRPGLWDGAGIYSRVATTARAFEQEETLSYLHTGTSHPLHYAKAS
ncbi:MAG TPA: hypothetical protein VK112_01110 [Fodinibius sp.]|nr:hypothetical protein [Fodinibius sp.]